MRFKNTANIISITLVVLFMVPAAEAMTVTLDAVENAGWSFEPLGQPYLKILDADNDIVWSGGNSDAITTWNDFADLVADLSDDQIGAAGSDPGLGEYEIQSGGNVFSDLVTPIYKTLSLPAGQYTISLDPGSESYNLKGYDAPESKYAGGNLWNAYVQLWTSDGQDLPFGDGDTQHESSAEALAAYDKITASLNLLHDADLHFYINDSNSLDNTGSVTLNIQAVPLPAAWLLFGSGMAALVGGRRFRKNGID
ncbi:VPLPA-CTERM sorting domain-containing protein [Desulfosarcina sp.]|uniref:VPLPA-CTERM sorting domain-containing protein n=1 Tax=Desulfosarcina sp. TaxID=2027861 RepID=UPI0035645F1B